MNPFDKIDIEKASEKDLDMIESTFNKCSTILNRIYRYYLNRSVRNKSKRLRKKYRKSRTARGFYRAVQ